MPSAIKDFIVDNYNSSPGPGRFFTDYQDSLLIGDINLLEKYKEVALAIKEDKDVINKVEQFLALIDSTFKAIYTEIERDNPNVTVSKADIAYSMVFKLGTLLGRHAGTDPDQLAIVDITPVLTGSAQKYFVASSRNVEHEMASFYDKAYEKAFAYLVSSPQIIQDETITNKDDFLKKMRVDESGAFRSLPPDYKNQLIDKLWQNYQLKVAAKNPFPLVLNEDIPPPMDAQETGAQKSLYEVFQEQENNALLLYAQNAILGDLKNRYMKDFPEEHPIYQKLKAHYSHNLSLFAKRFNEELATSPGLLDKTGELTAAGKQCRENILNEINALHPIPQKISAFLKAYQDFDNQMNNISNLLQSGSYPFETDQYKDLETLIISLDNAKKNLLATKAPLPDGGTREYTISNFKIDCRQACDTAARSSLKSDPGIWANVIKPTLLCLAVLCTAFFALASKAVREGITNESDKTAGMKKIHEIRKAVQDIRDTNPIEPIADESQEVTPTST